MYWIGGKKTAPAAEAASLLNRSSLTAAQPGPAAHVESPIGGYRPVSGPGDRILPGRGCSAGRIFDG